MTEEQGGILVVDDEETVRNLLQRILEGAGFSVVIAANGQETLDKVPELKPAVVLLDIKMPGMSGMDVLRELTVHWPDICVIMATAVVDTKTAIEAMKLGAYDYITKPFNRDDVILAVQRAFEKRELRLQSESYRIHLEEKVKDQAGRMQDQFSELLATLAREHNLMLKLAEQQSRHGQPLLSRLPPELQKPMASVEEYRDALLRILKKGAARPSHRVSTDGF